MKTSMSGNPFYFFEDLAPGNFFLCPAYGNGVFMKTETTSNSYGDLYNIVSLLTGLSSYIGSEASVIPVNIEVKVTRSQDGDSHYSRI